jgi:hypothetical protein
MTVGALCMLFRSGQEKAFGLCEPSCRHQALCLRTCDEFEKNDFVLTFYHHLPLTIYLLQFTSYNLQLTPHILST